MDGLSDRESTEFLERIGGLLRDDRQVGARADEPRRGGPGGAACERPRPIGEGTPGSTIDAGIERTSILHGYRLLAPLAEGGQGSVWRAVHEPSGRAAAVKILRFAGAQERARMQREARLAAALRHPGIVSIFDCGALPDAGFAIAMELVEGRTLDRWARAVDESGQGLRQRTRRKVRVLAKVAAALHAAHQVGVIHRDLKPGNIVVGDDDQPRLVDFGLAREALVDSGQTVTRLGEFAGTLAYAAPEQLDVGTPVGAAADIHALGAVLYELLAGRPRIEIAGSVEEVVSRVLHGEPAVVRRTVAGEVVDRDLMTVALKAMAKDPQRRYDSAAALRRDLERWLAGLPVDARRSSRLYLLGKTLRRHWLASGLAALALLAVAGFAVIVTSLYLQTEEARQRYKSLYEETQRTSAEIFRLHQAAVGAMAEMAVENQAGQRALAEAILSGRRLGSALASTNLQRVRELAAAGRIEEARDLAWREALAPSLMPPGIARIGSPRFEAALSCLRAVYIEEAADLGIAHVDSLLAAEIEARIERLSGTDTRPANRQALCDWLEIRLPELADEVEALEPSRGATRRPARP